MLACSKKIISHYIIFEENNNIILKLKTIKKKKYTSGTNIPAQPIHQKNFPQTNPTKFLD